MSGKPVMSEQPVMDDALKTTIDKAMTELFDKYSTKDITFHKLTKKYIADKHGWNTEELYDIEYFGDFVENIFYGTIKKDIVETICTHTHKFALYVENNIQQDKINEYSEQLPDNRQISREWYYDEDFYNDWNNNTTGYTTEYKQAFILSLIVPELSIPYFYEDNAEDYPNVVKINYGAVKINLGNDLSDVYPRHTIANLINDFKVLENQGKSDTEIKTIIYAKYALYGDIIDQILKNKKKNIYEILDILLVKNFEMKLSAINLYLLYGFYNFISGSNTTTGGGGNQGGSNTTSDTTGGGDTTPNANPNPNDGDDGKEMSNVIIRF